MLRRLLMSTLLLFAASSAFAKPPAEWQFQDWNSAVSAAERTRKPLFVLFGFEECPYCEHLYRNGMASAEARARFQAGAVLAYYDTRAHKPDEVVRLPGGATLSHAQFIQQLRAYPTPSWVFLSPKGNVLRANRGSKSTSRQLVSDLDAALAAR
jgi:thioredoxin-related protein